MDFTNEFRVSLPVEQTWQLFTDVERIAPCMPGAQLTEVHGDQYHGTVKVKVGPVTTQFKGVAAFEQLDATNRTMVLKAEGRDTRGQGNASALITVQLTPDGTGTKVVVKTDLKITGKLAQFGKGVIEDISKKLLAQFVDALENQLVAQEKPAPAAQPAGATTSTTTSTTTSAAAPAGAGAATTPSATTAPRRIESPEVEPLDLMDVARGAVLKRAIPPVAALVVLAAILIWWFNR
ncbi:carbon monoxide dehydrogenase [Carbonactinospora thermoautotrophica]|uniref:SRPBCC family protein n=1 Tax=Carbonactinospora thermoautotrophica TaxID=1469144 RepID=UPI0022708640|nr:SRPBCC family protein [Carbonactinospora thermoautotrophica]MCX9193908.1 carbon monoxide dehydrogenase [Carbonactinospora thermoautotrophica]